MGIQLFIDNVGMWYDDADQCARDFFYALYDGSDAFFGHVDQKDEMRLSSAVCTNTMFDPYFFDRTAISPPDEIKEIGHITIKNCSSDVDKDAGKFAKIHHEALTDDSVKLGPWVTIGKNARVGSRVKTGNWSHILDGCRIEEYAELGDWSTIGFSATVGKGAKLSNSWASVGAFSVVDPKAVLNDRYLPSGCRLRRNGSIVEIPLTDVQRKIGRYIDGSVGDNDAWGGSHRDAINKHVRSSRNFIKARVLFETLQVKSAKKPKQSWVQKLFKVHREEGRHNA